MNILRVTGLTALIVFATASSVQTLVGQLNANITPSSLTYDYMLDHPKALLKAGGRYWLEKGVCGTTGKKVSVLHDSLKLEPSTR